MKNLPLSVKLIGSFLLVALITVGVGIVGLNGVRSVSSELDDVANVSMPKAESLTMMEAELNDLVAVLNTSLSPWLSHDEREAIDDRIDAIRVRYGGEIRQYEELPHTSRENQLWTELQSRMADWAKINDEALALNQQLLETDILDPAGLQRDLQKFRGDHYKVADAVARLLEDGTRFEGGGDPTACAFGRWSAAYETENPEIEAALTAIAGHHDEFHETIEAIKTNLAAGRDAAADEAHEELMVHAQHVFEYFDELRAEADRVASIYETMTLKLVVDSKQGREHSFETLHELTDLVEEQAAEKTVNAEQVASRAQTVGIVGMTVGALLAMALGWVITRMITRPVLAGVEFAQRMAKGDLTADLDIHQKDEIGRLAASLNDMVERLRSVVGDVGSAASNVATGSEELSTSSTKLSKGSTEQAASVEEVSSSMEEMAGNIRQNTENAAQTEQIATKASQMATDGGQAVEETVAAMNQIAERIGIVGEIAGQTNLLALNAAIEAARAGEHGKGFAVVASEVRKLAERSQKSAAEISELSTNSVEVATRAGEYLQQIVPDIQKTADLVQEISAASREQNSGAEQINMAIQQLDDVIQQNASASEEMAATSEELAGQADQLQQNVGFFRVDTGH
ncbi:MAG TPA: methyl-accepting chemotaxis protein [Candidatus Krumholzibacteria bacterium]|nr:methyl-accepting chemotaxis protein [Candidatus Krumholzibacteria bacterium]